MKEGTAIEIWRAHQSLESASATILGRMIFAFSRLDVALALYLAWSRGGSQLEELTRKFENTSLQKKLDSLQEFVTAQYKEESRAHVLYDQWLKDADAIRAMRNDFIHGRWGIDHMKNEVVNVVGLPTSSEQQAKGWTIDELKTTLDQIELLRVRLAELGEKWPV